MAVTPTDLEAFLRGQPISPAASQEIVGQLDDRNSLVSIMGRRLSLAARQMANPDGPLITAIGEPLDSTLADLKGLNQQCVELSRAKRWQEALPLRLTTCRLAMRYLGEDHRDAMTYIHHLGIILYQCGQLDRAQRILDRAIDLRSQYLGEDKAETAISWTGLGRVLEAMGEYEDGAECHSFALSVTEEEFGPNHPETAVNLRDLGCVSLSLGDFPTATRCFERAVEIAREIDGEFDPIYASSLIHLASAREAVGDDASAERLYLEGLEILEASVGPDDADVAWCLDQLAGLRLKQGDGKVALALCERALGISVGDGRFGGMLRGSLTGNLGAALLMTNQARKAVRCCRDAIRELTKWLGENHPAISILTTNLELAKSHQSPGEAAELPKKLVAKPVYLPADGQTLMVIHFTIAA
jgi:tetratricopeptide (TPR) repeat protein